MNTATQTVETVETVDNFELALAGWLANAQQIVDEHYSNNYPNLPGARLTLERGRRYIRVVKQSKGDSTQRSAHCFIDAAEGPTRGFVLKSDSWKKPAPGPRGSIFTANVGVTPYGAHYAR
jgi:hypothetical protein